MTRAAPRSRRAAAAARARRPSSERKASRRLIRERHKAFRPRSGRPRLPRPLHARKVQTSPAVERSSEICGRLIAAEHFRCRARCDRDRSPACAPHPIASASRIGAGVAARAERQARDDPRRVVVGRQQMRPPRIGFSCLRHRQDADRAWFRRSLRGSPDPRCRKPTSACCCRNGRAPGPRSPADRRGEYGDRERGLQPDRCCQHLPPHANEGCGREGATVTSDEPADDLGLARRLIRRAVAVLSCWLRPATRSAPGRSAGPAACRRSRRDAGASL